MANLGINVGTDVKLGADTLTLNSEAGVYRQAVMETYEGIFSGRAVVTTAGTPVQLSASTTEVRRIDITAELDNTGVVCVGGPVTGSSAGVIAALATRTGIPLAPGDSVTLLVTKRSVVYLDAEVSGDGVTYNYYT